MNFLKQFHKFLLGLFALINGVMLYLFLLHLPFGVEPFLLSLMHWNEIENIPSIEVVTSLSFGLAIIAGIYVWGMSSTLKNRLLYMRWQFPHPAQDAFLTSRKQPFDSNKLLTAFPEIKDAGFSRVKQTETWIALHKKYAGKTVVLNTDIHWKMLRDLYCVSLAFLPVFLISWALNSDMPLSIVATYVFMFGVQFLFLLLTARRVGLKLVDNVLGVALGIDGKENTDNKKKF